MEVTRRAVRTSLGTVSYLRSASETTQRTGLFIHGLGCDGGWFPRQFESQNLSFLVWLVPDLLGHGESARSSDPTVYRMESQAQVLAELLAAEGPHEVVLVAHSMGGPIALRLAEKIDRATGPRLLGLVYAEGNIDENDAFLSRRIAEQSWGTFVTVGWERLIDGIGAEPEMSSYLQTLTSAGPLTVHASCSSLVADSREQLTTALLQRLTFPKLFIFGERNRGRFTSEAVARRFGEVRYIPGAGHLMYEDSPGTFWETIREFCASL